ncbi:hypothetical protein U1Q18_007067 [Sarracenia purpurea var. burkii]
MISYIKIAQKSPGTKRSKTKEVGIVKTNREREGERLHEDITESGVTGDDGGRRGPTRQTAVCGDETMALMVLDVDLRSEGSWWMVLGCASGASSSLEGVAGDIEEGQRTPEIVKKAGDKAGIMG